MTSSVAFGQWYKTRFGHLPLLGQAALWYFFGFVWIPILYFRTRDAAGQETVGHLLIPEGFDVTPAAPWRRLVGFLIDWTVGVALGFAFVSLLSPSEQRDVGPIFVAITPLYSTMLLEALFGRTLGKLLTGTRVINVGRRKPGWGRAFLRMLARCIPFEPLSLRNGVMWHDRLTGTRVVGTFEASLEASSDDQTRPAPPSAKLQAQQAAPAEQTMTTGVVTAERASLQIERAISPVVPPRATTAITLGQANQFLRYRIGSKEKLEAQVTLMQALLGRTDAPRIAVIVLRSTDPDDEFPWLLVKSGTFQGIGEMRGYAPFKEVFNQLFGDQPWSIAWADHISENCPGPGETVTKLGQERYAQIARDILSGKYTVERRVERPFN